MKISRNTQNNSLPFSNTFFLVCPLPGKFNGSLNGFGTGIHGKNHFVAKHRCNLVGETAKNTVVERAGRERQFLSLLNQGSHNTWMTVALRIVNEFKSAFGIACGQRPYLIYGSNHGSKRDMMRWATFYLMIQPTNKQTTCRCTRYPQDHRLWGRGESALGGYIISKEPYLAPLAESKTTGRGW